MIPEWNIKSNQASNTKKKNKKIKKILGMRTRFDNLLDVIEEQTDRLTCKATADSL